MTYAVSKMGRTWGVFDANGVLVDKLTYATEQEAQAVCDALNEEEREDKKDEQQTIIAKKNVYRKSCSRWRQ